MPDWELLHPETQGGEVLSCLIRLCREPQQGWDTITRSELLRWPRHGTDDHLGSRRTRGSEMGVVVLHEPLTRWVTGADQQRLIATQPDGCNGCGEKRGNDACLMERRSPGEETAVFLGRGVFTLGFVIRVTHCCCPPATPAPVPELSAWTPSVRIRTPSRALSLPASSLRGRVRRRMHPHGSMTSVPDGAWHA